MDGVVAFHSYSLDYDLGVDVETVVAAVAV